MNEVAAETHHPISGEPVYRAEDAVAATLYASAVSMKTEIVLHLGKMQGVMGVRLSIRRRSQQSGDTRR